MDSGVDSDAGPDLRLVSSQIVPRRFGLKVVLERVFSFERQGGPRHRQRLGHLKLIITLFPACDASCNTCFETSTFCSNNQLASNGKCVSTCPSGTFSSTGVCIPCHPDCASCSDGGAFKRCTSCPPSRPVLSAGRCLSTCAKNQFFDKTGGTCQKCDHTCSSCSGAGPSNCLACSSSSQVLRGGTCIAANCGSVVSGLGVCLSGLVVTILLPRAHRV